jgi:hypothetical protein
MKVHGTRILSLFTFLAISLPISPLVSAAEQKDGPLARFRLVQGGCAAVGGRRKTPE